MIVPQEIRQQYSEWGRFIDVVEKKVEETLSIYCKTEGYLFEGRKKTVESISEKIETGRFENWSELDDLYGCTIAVPLSKDEAAVLEFVRKTFDILSVKMRGAAAKEPETFRFDSTRIIAKLSQGPVPLPPGVLSIYSVKFEIQIKSLFEYAWAKTTHALTYKSNIVDWRRYRLTAHLKAASEQIDFLLLGFENAAEWVPNGKWPNIEDKVRIRAFFTSQVESGRIPTEVAPKDWSRFSDNIYTAVQILERGRPSSNYSKALGKLDLAFEILDRQLSATSLDMFPRSISLFQFVIGTLSSSGHFTGSNEKYFIPLGEDVKTFFPSLNPPGKNFLSNPV